MDTNDTTAAVTLAPARAYRELVYRPEGAPSRWLGRQFEVLARPGQQVPDPPRAGDLLVKVVLGHLGGGDCAVLTGSNLTRRRTGANPGWYAATADAASGVDLLSRRVLDPSRCVPPGVLLLRPRAQHHGNALTAIADLGADPAAEPEIGEHDAESRTPVPVDVAAAVPPFAAAERATVLEPLLPARESATAVGWNGRVHPATSGVTVDEIRAALRSYVDAAAVQTALQRRNATAPGAPIDASTATTDPVLAECVHQFQMKCYRDKKEHDGQAGESTLDSLGLIARTGTGLHRADRGHVRAQQRLNSRDAEVKAATNNAFSAANWFDRMVDPSVFGVRTKLGNGLHVVMVRKLRQAERHLLTLPAFAGMTPARLGAALGLTEKHGGARPAQTESTSVHTFGLAIDIEYLANPWVRSKASWRALQRASLVSGTRLTQSSAPRYFSSLGSDPARSTGQIWDELHRRNNELITYFQLGQDSSALRAALQAGQDRGTTGLINPAETLDSAVTRWRTQISQDQRHLAAGDFHRHVSPARGFLSHPRDLVIALRDHGCLAWGAVDLGPGARGSGDIMHFDARVESVGRVLTRDTQAFLPTLGHPCVPTTPVGTDGEDRPAAKSRVHRARDCWGKLFPTSTVLKKVKIFDLTQAPSQAVAGFDFSGWTNSSTRVYIADGVYDKPGLLEAVLYHESLHVCQFDAAGGKPPASYTEMMGFECQAYTKSAQWLDKRPDAVVRGWATKMREIAQLFCDEIQAARKATSTLNVFGRERRFKKFLLDQEFLPARDSIEDLYKPVGTKRNPSAAESTEPGSAATDVETIDAETAGPEIPTPAAGHVETDAESRPDKAKDTVRAQARRWGTDEAALMSALQALLPSEMAEVSADRAIVDTLRDELSGPELTAAGAQLARGRVGSMRRVEIERILAAPARHSFGTLAAAIARDVLLGHHEAFDRTGTGTIHGSHCPTPRPAGATTSDCTEYVKDVLDRAFTAQGLPNVWTDVLREATARSGRRGLKGTEVMKALQTMCGWEALFWAPDPLDTADGKNEHKHAYRVLRRKGTYYGITVDQAKSVINYRRTNAANPTLLAGVERLRRLQFGVLAARGGTHMAIFMNGSVYEVHRSSAATDRNAVEATPLEDFAWQSGAIAGPPGDLALAWATP